MSDDTTRKFGRVISSVKELGVDLHAQGIIDLTQLRDTIEARQRKARQLVDEGKSERQVARELGVSRGTIRNDLGRLDGLKKPNNGLKKPNEAQPCIEISVSPIVYVGNAIRNGNGFREAAERLSDKRPNSLNMQSFSKLLEELKAQIGERSLLLDAMNEYVQRSEHDEGNV